MIRQIFFTSLLFVVMGFSSSSVAQQRQLIDENCRQGSCWQTYLLEKRLIHQNQFDGQNNKLFVVDLEIVSDYSGTSRDREWIYCSLRNPFIAYDAPDDDEFMYLNLLSPANESGIGGANLGSYIHYWAVCHDSFGIDPFSMTSQARRLGYPDWASSGFLELPKVLLESFLNRS
ncbi:MAG: hypothetical protein ACHWZW_02955 [Spirulina sp.]